MQKKPASLKTVFNRNFVVLVIIPLFVVILATLGIVRNLLLQSSLNRVNLAMQNVMDTLTGEISDSSIKLVHFLFANDREVLYTAEKVFADDETTRYYSTNRLNNYFNSIVAQNNKLLAIHFYTDDNRLATLKDDLLMPLDTVRQMDWYQDSIADSRQVNIGFPPSEITYLGRQWNRGGAVIAVAYSPPKSRNIRHIETICLYTKSTALDMICDYSKNNKNEKIYLVDETGRALMAPSHEDYSFIMPRELNGYGSGDYRLNLEGEAFHYAIRPVPGKQWRIVCVSDYNSLLLEFNSVASLVLIISICIFSLFFLFSYFFLRDILNPLHRLSREMNRVENGDLTVQVEPGGKQEIQHLSIAFNNMVNQTRELILANKAEQKAKHEAEILALQSQINPHFLVNALNSMRLIAKVSQFDNLQEMAENLIVILNASFRPVDSVHTMRDEIDILESYISLMKIRYMDNFKVLWDLDGDSMDCEVPRLILQPIMENAITHGFDGKEEPGVITVRSQCRNGILTVDIRDDGVGMESDTLSEIMNPGNEQKKSRKIGIMNVHRRIQLNYGSEYGLEAESRPGHGARFSLKLPAVRNKEKTSENVL